jgi:hypothetical protein
MKIESFGFNCGHFGGVQTSDDGFIIPIAKTKPFEPSMLPFAGPPPGGAPYRLKVHEGETVSFMVDVTALWVTHHKTGATWLALRGGDAWQNVAHALDAFAGKHVGLVFEPR